MKLWQKVIAGIVLLLILSPAFGQESQVKINHQGKAFTMLKHAWTAQWITHPKASTLDFGVFHFRRNFDLTSVPKELIVYLSADNRYRFYVNGQFVCDGPARGDINHWRYETVDIAKYLQTGKNTLAVEVVNFGEFRHAAQQTFQTAFILQGTKDFEPDLNTSKTSEWKVTKNLGYDFIPFVSDSVGGYYAAGPGDILNANQYPWGWEQTQYNDSQWLSPRAAMVEFAVGRGFLFGSTWYLVPREIPFMEHHKERFHQVVRTEGINNINAFAKGQAITIPKNTKVSILLDNQTHTIGYPEMIFSKGKNAKIKVTYAEALFFKDSKERVAHKGWEKGHRNKDWDKKEIRGIYDIIIADGGDKRKYQPLEMRTYRFVQLDIETQDEPLTIDDFYGVFTGYPFREKAKFDAGDKHLDKIWETAWRTLRNSSTEIFIDPYYEQLQYVGDSKIESMVSIYVSGDDHLMRKAIKSFDASRLPNGLTQSRFPSYIVQIIPTYSLLWVDMIHDYYMYRDDPEFIKQFLPGIESVLSWFERKTDHTGMLTGLEWWNFTDWTKGFQNGIPPGADDGYSANVSLQYVYALQNAAEIFDHFNQKEKADHYRKMADNMKYKVRERCYDISKKLFAERPEKDVFSQHTNIFAILTDAVPEKDQPALMERLLAPKDNFGQPIDIIKASIYFQYYVNRALQKTGKADNYLDRLQQWDNMLDMGMTTFGETDDAPRSDCHAWSSTPCFEFLHTVTGIQPAAPGFKKVLIEPALGHLKKIETSFPHPAGKIIVKLKKKRNGHLKGSIVLPKDITGTFRANGKTILLKNGMNKI